MSGNTTEREKSALKTTPSPQGVTLKYSDLPSHFISCMSAGNILEKAILP